MRSTLDEFSRELTELKALVESIRPVNEALKGHQDTLVSQYVTIRRRFDDAAFSITLYASFEKFVENLVIACARSAATLRPYKELPEKLRTRHLHQSAGLLTRQLGVGRYSAIRELDIIRNLFDCLSDVTPYTLNEAAIAAHDMNLRPKEIDRLFAAVDIERICSSVRSSDEMLAWYCSSKGISGPLPEKIPVTVIENRLTDVVDRRNQIAHRGGNPDNLLGHDEMADTMSFVKAFSTSIYKMVVAQYLRDHYVESRRGSILRLQEGPFQGGNIVVVERPACRLYLGQPAFVLVETTGARWGRINSLRMDDVSVPIIEKEAVAANGIGIGFDFKCPRDATLVALEMEDELVWSPQAPAAS